MSVLFNTSLCVGCATQKLCVVERPPRLIQEPVLGGQQRQRLMRS